MRASSWELHATPAGRHAALPELARHGLAHGFSCRDAAAPGSRELAARLAGPLGLAELPRSHLRQRHTDRVHWAVDGPAPVGDGLVAGPGRALALETADCPPILLLDPGRRACAAVHAGWRGTLAGILPRALALLQERTGCAPGELWMAVGPCIRRCCFEVGPEVVSAFRGRWDGAGAWLHPGPRGRPHLDLVAANLHQAVRAGLDPSRMLDPGICSVCRRDLFHSHRGDAGAPGRTLTLAGIRPLATPS